MRAKESEEYKREKAARRKRRTAKLTGAPVRGSSHPPLHAAAARTHARPGHASRPEGAATPRGRRPARWP